MPTDDCCRPAATAAIAAATAEGEGGCPGGGETPPDGDGGTKLGIDLATAAASEGRFGCCIRSKAEKSGEVETLGRDCEGVDVGDVDGEDTLVRGLYALRLAKTLWNDGAPFSPLPLRWPIDG